MTIEVITLQIQSDQVRKKNLVMRVVVVSWGILYTVFQCLAVYYGRVIGEDLYYSALLYTVLMLLLCIVYTIVIVLLNKQMNKLSENFKSEKASIN